MRSDVSADKLIITVFEELEGLRQQAIEAGQAATVAVLDDALAGLVDAYCEARRDRLMQTIANAATPSVKKAF